MADALLVSYTTRSDRGHSTALRVWPDGRVESQSDDRPWQSVTRLGPQQVAKLRTHVEQSGLWEPLQTGVAPARASHTTRCTWHANDAGRHADVMVEPWSDENPAAAPLRTLALQIDELVGAAQDGHSE